MPYACYSKILALVIKAKLRIGLKSEYLIGHIGKRVIMCILGWEHKGQLYLAVPARFLFLSISTLRQLNDTIHKEY